MTITVMKDYPKQVTLPGEETEITIRTLEADDASALLEFFLRIPEEDRFYLKEDVTSAEVIDSWVSKIDYNRVVPLVALAGTRIVADATLHRPRPGARRHVGEIRAVVDPEYRNQGLGTLLIREMVDIAYDNAMDSVIFELVEGKEDDAIKVCERLGFRKIAVLDNFIKSMDQQPHNLALLELSLDDWLEKTPAL